MARTDTRAVLGLDAAIERANAYAQAGADVIFVEAPRTAAEVERIAKEVDAPLLINLVVDGLTPDGGPEYLQDLRYAIAIRPVDLFAAAAHATQLPNHPEPPTPLNPQTTGKVVISCRGSDSFCTQTPSRASPDGLRRHVTGRSRRPAWPLPLDTIAELDTIAG